MVVELENLGQTEDAGKRNPPWHHLVNEPAEVDWGPVSNQRYAVKTNLRYYMTYCNQEKTISEPS
jgi:hypothetical protein